MNTLQRTALNWYNRDVMVLPIKSRSKAAAIRWKRFQTKCPSWSLVRTWFENESRNLAVLCGAVSKNLVVLDFDVADVYQKWSDVHEYHLAQSYTVETSRGMHVYLFCDELPKRTFSLEGVDIKVSGYCLAPPSIHPSGVEYTVYRDGEVKRIAVVEVALVGLSKDGGAETAENCEGRQVSDGDPRIGRQRRNGVMPSSSFSALSAPQPAVDISRLSRVKLYPGIAKAIKSKLSILDVCWWYTRMEGPGVNGYYWGRCPAHDDHHPSFSCCMDKDRAHCWKPGCKLHSEKGYDCIDLVSILEGLSLRDAMASLALSLGLVKVE